MLCILEKLLWKDTSRTQMCCQKRIIKPTPILVWPIPKNNQFSPIWLNHFLNTWDLRPRYPTCLPISKTMPIFLCHTSPTKVFVASLFPQSSTKTSWAGLSLFLWFPQAHNPPSLFSFRSRYLLPNAFLFVSFLQSHCSSYNLFAAAIEILNRQIVERQIRKGCFNGITSHDKYLLFHPLSIHSLSLGSWGTVLLLVFIWQLLDYALKTRQTVGHFNNSTFYNKFTKMDGH